MYESITGWLRQIFQRFWLICYQDCFINFTLCSPTDCPHCLCIWLQLFKRESKRQKAKTQCKRCVFSIGNNLKCNEIIAFNVATPRRWVFRRRSLALCFQYIPTIENNVSVDTLKAGRGSSVWCIATFMSAPDVSSVESFKQPRWRPYSYILFHITKCTFLRLFERRFNRAFVHSLRNFCIFIEMGDWLNETTYIKLWDP